MSARPYRSKFMTPHATLKLTEREAADLIDSIGVLLEFGTYPGSAEVGRSLQRILRKLATELVRVGFGTLRKASE